MDVVECQPQMKVLGKSFKKEAKIVSEYLSKLEAAEIEQIEQKIKDNGYDMYILKTLYSFQ